MRERRQFRSDDVTTALAGLRDAGPLASPIVGIIIDEVFQATSDGRTGDSAVDVCRQSSLATVGVIVVIEADITSNQQVIVRFEIELIAGRVSKRHGVAGLRPHATSRVDVVIGNSL